MLQKIFISYRRQDTAANALSIGQYLEHEFCRKNVFIDVDMKAGSNFPAVLEQRLAECKVMLVLIEQNWLEAKDEQGKRRLDDPDDWVRLEVAHALKRNITVIPVRINGADLPSKSALPDEIRGLLNHQATSVAMTGFRHDMSGLVRDIKSIPNNLQGRSKLLAAASLVLLMALGITAFSFRTQLGFVQSLLTQGGPAVAKQNDIWKSGPGDWVMYAVDSLPVAYYYKSSAIKISGDRIVYTARYPLKPTTTTQRPSFEDATTVLRCKEARYALAEKITYDADGSISSHFKWGEPFSMDMSNAEEIKQGTILSTAALAMCDERNRAPLLKHTDKLTFLSKSPIRDGELFYGTINETEDPTFKKGMLLVVKFSEDHQYSDLFPGQAVIGLPTSYRLLAEQLQIDCSGRKLKILKMEYYDAETRLEHLHLLSPTQPLDVHGGSIFDMASSVACGGSVRAAAPAVGGVYEGTNNAAYRAGARGEQKIKISVDQRGDDIAVVFQAAGGGEGRGSGKFTGDKATSVKLQIADQNCPGAYDASFEFSGESLRWTYKGEDCGGPMEGSGLATKIR